MEKTITFEPAYDKRDPDPSKNHGIHGAELRFILKGTEGAVQFVLSTNWQLPHVRAEQDTKILQRARNGVRDKPFIGQELPPEFGEVSKRLERATRYLYEQPPELDQLTLEVTYHPMPVDLGYHSPKPRYEGQTCVTESCKYLDGKPCYYDGSGLAAEKVYETLLREGSDGVWKKLEEYYARTFSVVAES